VTDVKLYFCRGWYWLVVGERYLDEVLNGTLAPELSVEVVDCDEFAVVEAAWENPRPGALPWQIHAGIGDHYRRQSGAAALRETAGKRFKIRRDLPRRGV